MIAACQRQTGFKTCWGADGRLADEIPRGLILYQGKKVCGHVGDRHHALTMKQTEREVV